MAKMMLRNRKGRKSNSSKIPCNESSNESDNCVICLDTVDCRGKLGVCDHWFCFACIFEWSKNTNTCPVCKKKFRCITKTHLKQGKSPVQQVRVGDVDQRVWNDDDELDVLSVVDSDDDSVYYNMDTSDYDESSSFVNVFMTIHQYDCDDSFLIGCLHSESSSDDDLDDSSRTSDTFSEDSSSNLGSSSLSETTDNWSPQGNVTPIPKKKIKVTQKSVTVDSSDSDKDMEWDEHEPLCDRWKRLTYGNGAVEAPFRHRSTTEKSSPGSRRNSQGTSSGQNSRETSKRGESSRKKEKQKKTPSTSTKKSTRKSKTSGQSCSTASTSGQWLNARTRRAESRTNRQPTPEKPKPSSTASTSGQWLNARTRRAESRTNRQPTPEKPKPSSTASTARQWLNARTRRAESRTNRQPTPEKPKPRGRATEQSCTASTSGQWLNARTRRAESRANRQPAQEKPKPRGRATEQSCTASTSGEWLNAKTRRRGESASNRQPTPEKPKPRGRSTKHRSSAEQWLNASTPRAESRRDTTRKRAHYSTNTYTISSEAMSSKNGMATSSNEPSMSKSPVLPKKRTAKPPVQPVDSDSETSDEVLIPSKRRSAKRVLTDNGSDESPREKNTKYIIGRRVLRERQNNPDED